MTTNGSAMPSFDDTQFLPLERDAAIMERVADLIGRANQRQVWLLFLDELERQLPLLIPIESLPTWPSTQETAAVLDRVREVMGDIGARSIVVVFERYGPAALSEQDIAWASTVRDQCGSAGVTLRAMLLSHRSGVRWIAPDDLA